MILIIILISITTFNSYSFVNNKKIIPKNIAIECNKHGYPTINSIKALVTTQYLQQFNNNVVVVKELPGGFYTEKMYLIATKKNKQIKPLYFFKISKKQSSTKNLLKIQEGPIGQKITHKHLSKNLSSNDFKNNLPVIIWLEDIFIYKNNEGITKSIEVTPSAKGELLIDILNSQDLDKIKKAAYCLGKSLAKFHQFYMDHSYDEESPSWKTICHGDFSIKNTLFDATTQKIYFIDNETMQEGSIAQDIKTILISLLMFNNLQRHTKKRWPLYLEYCQTFLNSYITSYSKHLHKDLALFIKKTLEKGLNKNLYEKAIKNGNFNHAKFNKNEFQTTIHDCLKKFIK